VVIAGRTATEKAAQALAAAVTKKKLFAEATQGF